MQIKIYSAILWFDFEFCWNSLWLSSQKKNGVVKNGDSEKNGVEKKRGSDVTHAQIIAIYLSIHFRDPSSGDKNQKNKTYLM